jgi:hypothetical protein
MTVRSGVLLLVLWVSAQADTLILRNGTRVTGRWWACDADVISFLVNNHLGQYSRADVSEVVFGTAPGSAASRVTAPNQIGAIYFQDDSGHLLPLERTQGVANRTTAAGAARSPFRLKSDFNMRFVVEMPNGTQPSAFSLYPLETEANRRETKSGDGNGRAKAIPFMTRKVSENTYALVPVDALAPGEYGFRTANSSDAYCFGVDPATPGAR